MNEHERVRRRLLRQAVAAVPAVVALPLLARSGPARAGSVAKEDFHYQDRPHGAQRCAGCAAFIAPPAGQSLGTCSILAGPISPNGWCMAFSAR
jgi:hypothetical protein